MSRQQRCVIEEKEKGLRVFIKWISVAVAGQGFGRLRRTRFAALKLAASKENSKN
jgi:hypothetical protein